MNPDIITALQTGNITNIDFDLTPDAEFYALITLRHMMGRCRAFYCFRADDTRDEGEDCCSEEAFSNICSTIAEILTNNDTNVSSVTHKLAITTDTDSTFKIENTLSGKALRKLIAVLTDHITDYAFLNAFQRIV